MNLMHVACLDLEGVLFPEIWIQLAEKTGIDSLTRTTRDEPDYNTLMQYRLAILKEHNIGIHDIQKVIMTLDLLDGADEFLGKLREYMQIVVLSDTFVQFIAPLMPRLFYPVLLCNELTINGDGSISGYRLRQKDGKKAAVAAFRNLQLTVHAAGDSYNDTSMLQAANRSTFFRAPDSIRKEFPSIPYCRDFSQLLQFFADGVSSGEEAQ